MNIIKDHLKWEKLLGSCLKAHQEMIMAYLDSNGDRET